jgi:quinol monooxygenase YgiN
MPILRIEFQIRDFDMWKAAFDHDVVGRQQSGVRRYRIFRPIDDPNYIMLDFEFDNASEAEAFLAALRRDVWSSREAAPSLLGTPQTRIVEAVESKEY